MRAFHFNLCAAIRSLKDFLFGPVAEVWRVEIRSPGCTRFFLWDNFGSQAEAKHESERLLNGGFVVLCRRIY